MKNAKKYCRDGVTVTYNPNFPAAQLLLSAHGEQGGTPFIVPRGTQIWFYCPDGHSLVDINPLNFSKLDTHPYEIFEGGASCPNYSLSHFEDSDEMIAVSSMYFEQWVLAKRHNLSVNTTIHETRPVALGTIDKRPWYSFGSLTLKDVVNLLQKHYDELDYGSILCAFCRSPSNPLKTCPSYDCTNNQEKNIRRIKPPARSS